MRRSNRTCTFQWQRPICSALLFLGLLGMSAIAVAAPWRSHIVLPSGDEVLLRTGGLRIQPSGSRGEIDLPVRVRFAKAVDSPSGPVDLVDAKARLICADGTASASAIKPRHADGKSLAAKNRNLAVTAVRAPLQAVLSTPAVFESLCKR
jgi:hypothetical protein